MPLKVIPYRRKRNYRKALATTTRRRRYVKKRGNYRGTVARIPRPITMKPKSVCQKLVYYNNFHCIPALDNQALPKQQNWYFTIALNSPWPFINTWSDGANANNMYMVPNQQINELPTTLQPDATTTCMPGLKDGYDLFHQYQNGLVLGTKVILSAQPTGLDKDSTDDEQSGVFYAIRHAKNGFGLDNSSTINDIQKLPFRQQKRMAGPSNTSFQDRNTGCRIVVNHSPKKFNNVGSLRDNDRFQFSQASGAHPNGLVPDDNDFLTCGIVPSLVAFQSGGTTVSRKAPNFKLSMRIEQTILFTEPLENLSEGTGNYSLPWDSRKYGGIGWSLTQAMRRGWS